MHQRIRTKLSSLTAAADALRDQNLQPSKVPSPGSAVIYQGFPPGNNCHCRHPCTTTYLHALRSNSSCGIISFLPFASPRAFRVVRSHQSCKSRSSSAHHSPSRPSSQLLRPLPSIPLACIICSTSAPYTLLKPRRNILY